MAINDALTLIPVTIPTFPGWAPVWGCTLSLHSPYAL